MARTVTPTFLYVWLGWAWICTLTTWALVHVDPSSAGQVFQCVLLTFTSAVWFVLCVVQTRKTCCAPETDEPTVGLV